MDTGTLHAKLAAMMEAGTVEDARNIGVLYRTIPAMGGLPDTPNTPNIPRTYVGWEHTQDFIRRREEDMEKAVAEALLKVEEIQAGLA